MILNEIFPNGAEFMDWLANNCYSCEKLGDGATQNNADCELEPIISYSDLNKEIDENLTKIISENGKFCKCKNFVMATRKILVFFAILLTITGCNTKNQKVYRNKISFSQPEKLKVLYAAPEQEKLPQECYKINFPDADIAEQSLQLETIRRLNAHNKAFLPKAQKELKEFQKFIANLKLKISERNKQYKRIKELEKQINESKQKIEQIKSGETK